MLKMSDFISDLKRKHMESSLYVSLLFRAQSFAERLRLGLAVMHGEAQCSESDMADGRHSPPCVRNTFGHSGLELPCKSHPTLNPFSSNQ